MQCGGAHRVHASFQCYATLGNLRVQALPSRPRVLSTVEIFLKLMDNDLGNRLYLKVIASVEELLRQNT